MITTAAGARALSASQLPIFLLRPPAGYGVLTTTGRKTGKPRRRCIRAIRRGQVVYIIAIRGARTGWLRNVRADPNIRLRIRGGTFNGTVRELRDAAEREVAMEVYCGSETPFEYLQCVTWLKGRPTRSKIKELYRSWFEDGIPLVVELDT